MTTKYLQQHVIDVGDVPGHQIRIYEYRREYGEDAPVIAGLKLKESWVRGISDYSDSTGPGTVYTMENGDKMYARGSVVTQGVPAAGGKKTLNTMAASSITGGTGKLLGIRGVVRSETFADLSADVNRSKGEIEYWMEK